MSIMNNRYTTLRGLSDDKSSRKNATYIHARDIVDGNRKQNHWTHKHVLSWCTFENYSKGTFEKAKVFAKYSSLGVIKEAWDQERKK